MKKFIVTVIILVLLYLASYLFFGGFVVGYSNGYFVVNTYVCADVCPDYGHWYKKYYGKISQDQCVSMGGLPKLVGLIHLGADGKPGPGSIGGYDGCEVK